MNAAAQNATYNNKFYSLAIKGGSLTIKKADMEIPIWLLGSTGTAKQLADTIIEQILFAPERYIRSFILTDLDLLRNREMITPDNLNLNGIGMLNQYPIGIYMLKQDSPFRLELMPYQGIPTDVFSKLLPYSQIPFTKKKTFTTFIACNGEIFIQ
jgi:hypothetical protein